MHAVRSDTSDRAVGAVTNPAERTDRVAKDFPTVAAYDDKHPCEKPLAMMEHIITASSKPEVTVLDCFAGSGVVGKAARNLKRKAILCELDAGWYGRIKDMLRQSVLF